MDRRALICRVLAVPAAAAAAAAPLLPVRTWFDYVIGRISTTTEIPLEVLKSPNLLEPFNLADLIDADALVEQFRQSSPICQLADELLASRLRPGGQITLEAYWPPAPKVMQVGDEIRITMPDGQEFSAEVSLITVNPGPTIDSLSFSAEIRPTGDSGTFD